MKLSLKILPIIKSGIKTCQDYIANFFDDFWYNFEEYFILIPLLIGVIFIGICIYANKSDANNIENINLYNIDRKIQIEQQKHDMKAKLEFLKKLRQENGTIVP